MIRTQRWIECSVCDAEFAGAAHQMGGETSANIRKRARAAGWRRAVLAGEQEDICPDHPDIASGKSSGPRGAVGT